MCRKRLYFKGMHRFTKEWEEETREKQSQDAYGEAVDYILGAGDSDEDEESEEETDSDYDSQEDEELPGPVFSLPESDTDSEEDEDGDSVWSEDTVDLATIWGKDPRISELLEVERRMTILREGEYNVQPELLVYDYYVITRDPSNYEVYEDLKNTKFLFVSNHKGAQNGSRRCSKRVQGKRDQALGVDLVLIISV